MKNLSLKLVVIFILIFISQNIFAQSTGALSGNNYFVATSLKEGSKYVIAIHKFVTNEYVRKLEYSYTNTKKIDEIKFSYTGKFLYTKQSKIFTIFDVMGDKQSASILGADQVIFAKNKDFFIVLKNAKISAYDCYSGKLIRNYITPSGKVLNKIQISPDDNFIIGYTNKKRIIIWKEAETKYFKEFYADNISFRANMKYATSIRKETEGIRVVTYELPSFYQERVKTNTLLLKNQEVGGMGQHKFFSTKCSLSPDGQYVALYTAKEFHVNIYIYNTFTGKLVWIINNTKNTSNQLYPHYWTNNKTLIAYGADMLAGEYDIQAKTTKSLALNLDAKPNETELSNDKQLKNRIFSPNQNYVVMQANNTFYIRASKIPHEKISMPNFEFLCFSQDSRYVFVKNNNTVNVILTSDIDKAMKTNSKVALHPMKSSLKVVTPEKLIANDAKPPKGYAYFYVNNTKQIAMVDTVKLNYVFRSVNANANNVEIKVNLVDRNGNVFLGATEPNWKYIWCNIILQNSNNQVSQVQDFIVTEVHETEPAAIALVLDHSGSMGTKRANALQFGALKLIKKKNPNDAYMLIKYDNKVKLESKLSKDKILISRKLNNTGITDFGGGTALVDATYLAVNKLKDANEYKRKVIILFTDGFENSSFYNKYDVLKNAIENNIEIHVIGFGNKINEPYLKSLAYSTGGSYNHLYHTDDLIKIFMDIDYKRKHYYSIKFKTKTQGKQIALLELCQDEENHDSLFVSFDNSDKNKRYDERNPVPEISNKSIKFRDFKKLVIKRNLPLEPITSKNILKDFGIIDFPDILFQTNKSRIVKSEEKGIIEISKFLIKYPFIYIEIHGHTDNQGTPESNLTLSKARADAAKKLLTDKGVASGRIRTKGFGETKPIANNDTEEGRTKNRRIEFHIFKQK